MFVLPKLPYAIDALEPVISTEALRLHHEKHHGGYVTAVNALLQGMAPAALEAVIATAHATSDSKLFNNAAQMRNHSFFWVAMSAVPQTPEAALLAAIDAQMGGMAALKSAFIAAGAGQFGSGWVWLVADAAGALAVTTSHDANDWLGETGSTPLIVCDVWEHAYYVAYRNDRAGFLAAWFDALPHWQFAAAQYAAAMGEGEKWRHPEPETMPPANTVFAGHPVLV